MTNNLGLFSVSVGSAEAERRLLGHKAKLDSYTKCTKETLESYIKLPEYSFNYPLRQYWNCGIYTTFNALANFDPVSLVQRSVKSIGGLLENQSTDVKAKKD